jgi:hypothetical protein
MNATIPLVSEPDPLVDSAAEAGVAVEARPADAGAAALLAAVRPAPTARAKPDFNMRRRPFPSNSSSKKMDLNTAHLFFSPRAVELKLPQAKTSRCRIKPRM